MSILTVATYNVHEWVGRDGRKDPERVIRVVREFRADVVALQEVSLPLKRSMPFALSVISEMTGMHAVPGPTLFKRENDYGNLLLSRRPLAHIETIDLSVDVREPRGAIAGVFPTSGGPLKVITTHLGLQNRERRRQWPRLIEKFVPHAGEKIILMGDLNEWNPMGRTVRWIRSFFAPAASPRTYPSWCPLFSLDRILAYPKTTTISVDIHRSKLARIASDHLPVVGRIEV